MRHLKEERHKAPFHHFRYQKILRLTDHCGNTTQRRTDSAMHQEIAEKRAKTFQIATMQFMDFIVRAMIVVVIKLLARRDLVVDTVKPDRDGDNDGGDR